jgi:hypothetical protein
MLQVISVSDAHAVPGVCHWILVILEGHVCIKSSVSVVYSLIV